MRRISVWAHNQSIPGAPHLVGCRIAVCIVHEPDLHTRVCESGFIIEMA